MGYYKNMKIESEIAEEELNKSLQGSDISFLSDDSDLDPTLEEIQNILSKLSKPLFNRLVEKLNGTKTNAMGGRGERSFSDNVVNMATFAVTLNPDPFRIINPESKMFKDAKQKHQRDFINYAIDCIEKKFPIVKHTKICFEVCPKLKQSHAHCVVKMPANFSDSYKDFMRSSIVRVNSPSWRHTDIQQIYDIEGWTNYMSKDIDK